MISCILLTAGESTRFGSPKALAQIHQDAAIEHIQKTLLKTSVDEIIILTGAHKELIEPYVFNHNKVRLVYNKDYKLGQTSSFQTGILSVANKSQAFMLWPVDCPLITYTTIDQLIKNFNSQKPTIMVPTFNSRRGHPPIFNASLKNEILSLSSRTGINTLFQSHPPLEINVKDQGILKTFNTPQEFDQIL